jgi:hypothetical protein
VTVYLDDPDFTLYCGDALETLRQLPDESVHMCVTSPPFYGLRDYGTGTWEGGDPDHEHDRVLARGGRGGSGAPGKQTQGAFPDDVPAKSCSCGAVYTDTQIGLEETPEQWVTNLTDVFREVRRVLRKDGTLWLEVGDSYASNPAKGRQRDIQRPQRLRRTVRPLAKTSGRDSEGKGFDRRPLAPGVRTAGGRLVAPQRHHLGTTQPHARISHRPAHQITLIPVPFG